MEHAELGSEDHMQVDKHKDVCAVQTESVGGEEVPLLPCVVVRSFRQHTGKLLQFLLSTQAATLSAPYVWLALLYSYPSTRKQAA